MTPHTTPITRYRQGDRTRRARAAHSVASRIYRREIADAMFGPAARARVLDLIKDGTQLREAAASEGVTPAQVHGRARWDDTFKTALEAALEQYSAPFKSRHCGTPTGYRAGCRCGLCRTAHNTETRLYR